MEVGKVWGVWRVGQQLPFEGVGNVVDEAV